MQMIKQFEIVTKAVIIMALGLLWNAQGQTVTPNYVETKTYQDDGVESNALRSRTYSDGLGRTIQSQTNRNTPSTLSYDSWETGTWYDDAGRQTKTSGNVAATTGFAYDPNLWAQGVAIADGFQSSMYFDSTAYYDDPLSRVREKGAPGTEFAISTTPGTAHTVRYWYFGTGQGQAGGPIDANGFLLPTSFSHNGDGSVIRTSTITFLDNAASTSPNLVTNPSYFLTVMLDENNVLTQQLKDIFGNTVYTSSMKDNINTVVSSSQYDILGNQTQQTPPSNGSGAVSLLPTNYTYNTLGQLATKTIADYIGPGNAQVTETYTYDNAGRLIETDRSAFGSVFKSLSTVYDNLGRIISQSPEEGPYTGPALSYCYDGINSGNNYSVISQECLSEAGLSPDEISEIITDLTNDGNARGKLTAAVYTNLIEKITADGSLSFEQDYVMDFYTYDDEGRISYHYKIIPSLPPQRFSYSYDLMGRTTSVMLASEDHNRTWYYAYDDDGRLSTISDNDPSIGTVVSYDYNDLGLLSGKHFLRENDGIDPASYIVQNTYNIRNWLVEIDAGNGGERFPLLPNTYGEDIAYSSSPQRLSGTGVNLIPQYNGNISGAAHYYGLTNPVLLRYQYDLLNRLTGTTASDGADGNGFLFNSQQGGSQVSQYAESFAYNDDGRFLTKYIPVSGSQKNYFYYPNSSRLQTTVTDGPSLYFYDYNGNLVYDANKKMVITYDWRNMPVKFSFYSTPLPDLSSYSTTIANGTITQEQLLQACGNLTPVSEVVMLYDADGNRVSKIQVSG